MFSNYKHEVTDFVAINFSEYFKSARENLFSKLNQEQSLRKVYELLFTFLTTPDEVLLMNMCIAIILRF